MHFLHWKWEKTPSFIRLYQHHCRHIVTRSLLKSAFLVSFPRLQSSAVKFFVLVFHHQTSPDLQVFRLCSRVLVFDLKLGFHCKTNYQTTWMSLSYSNCTTIQYDGKMRKKNFCRLTHWNWNLLWRCRKKNKFDAYQMLVPHRFFFVGKFFSLRFHY